MPPLAAQAAELFRAGWQDEHGVACGCRNVSDAVERSTAFQELAAEADACPATLLAALNCAQPGGTQGDWPAKRYRCDQGRCPRLAIDLRVFLRGKCADHPAPPCTAADHSRFWVLPAISSRCADALPGQRCCVLPLTACMWGQIGSLIGSAAWPGCLLVPPARAHNATHRVANHPSNSTRTRAHRGPPRVVLIMQRCM